MAETTLTVPAEHVAAFRIGLLRELAFDGDWLKDQAKEARRISERAESALFEGHRYPSDLDPFDCLEGPLREAHQDGEVLRQLGAGQPETDITVTCECVSLKHSLEATARHFGNALTDCEFGDDWARKAVAAVTWAASEAERLGVEEAAEEHEAVAA